MKKSNTHVIIPSELYQTIMSELNVKFAKLPIVLDKWFTLTDSHEIPEIEKIEYVEKMRIFLQTYQPSPTTGYVGNLEKIGTNSIYKKSLVKKFGKITGEILFDIMAISSEYKAKIIALGNTTFSLIQETNTKIKRGSSKVKKELKTRARIRTPLLIGMLFMSSHNELNNFINEFEIDGISSLTITIAGIIILANG